MVRAWYMDVSSEKDQREPHMHDPPKFLSLDDLKKKCNVRYWQLDTEHYDTDGKLAQIRKDNHYDYEDKVVIKEDAEGYHEMIKKFFMEHIHPDDETRFIVEGSGYFDIRDPVTDEWIRIEVVAGDMISLPAGSYHRFTLDTKNFIVARRYFAGTPVWTPLHRPQDDNPVRLQYLKAMTAK